MAFLRLFVPIPFITTALIGLVLLFGRSLPHTAMISFESEMSGRPDIYLFDLGRAVRVNLTRDPAYAVAAAWSPDGARMVFASARSGRLALYSFDFTTLRLEHLLTPEVNQANGQVDTEWSPDGRWLAINLQSNPPYLYVLDMEAAPITFRRVNILNSANDLAWSPDSTRVSISGYFNNGTQIVVYDVNEQRLVNLTWAQAAFTLDRGAAWSPDAARIAFLRDQGSTRLYIMNVDGTGERALLEVGLFGYSRPVWSPDGRWLTVAAEGGVLRVDADTGDSTLIVSDNDLHTHQLLTPDGTSLIDTRYNSRDGWRLFMLRIDGSDLTMLPTGARDALYPQWVPQGFGG